MSASKQKPKVFSYFLFMQEQRQVVPGWANKSNNELQALCDPLWRKLDKEKKEKYKKMKKAYKENVRLEEEQRFGTGMNVDRKFKVLVGQVDKPDIVWITPVQEMEEVQKQLTQLVMVSLERVEVGSVAACRFSEDGIVYRCQVVAREEGDIMLIRYMDFGNKETVKTSELCHLPASLSKMGPLAVRVRVGEMENVKDNEKNRAKVEKKLGIMQLEVSTSIEGLATFYDNGNIIAFKSSKTKEEQEFVAVEKELLLDREKLSQEEQQDGESLLAEKEVKVKTIFVRDLVGSLLISSGKVQNEETLPRERVSGHKEVVIGECMNKEVINTVDSEIRAFEVSTVAKEADQDVEENEVKYVVESGAFDTKAKLFNQSEDIRGCSDILDKQMESLDDSVETVGIKTGHSKFEVEDADCRDKAQAVITKSDSFNLPLRRPTYVEVGDTNGIQSIRKHVSNDLNIISIVSPSVPKPIKKLVHSSSGVRDEASLRSYSSKLSGKKKLNYHKVRKHFDGWQVGDAVVAFWSEDGVWRDGIVHDIVGDLAYVVCKEELVMAARVRLDQLRHSAMPIEVLNMMEEELTKDWEEEESSLDSLTGYSLTGSDQVTPDDQQESELATPDDQQDRGVASPDHQEKRGQDAINLQQKKGDDIHDDQEEDIKELLFLLSHVDMTTLTSTILLLLPSLSSYQVERLVAGMVSQDLLISAALHPDGYLLAMQLVHHVMTFNSNTKEELLICLARQVDAMQVNLHGREVLKMLEGFI